MANIRINEIAKELQVEAKDILAFVNENGVEAKTAQKSLEPEIEEKVRKALSADRPQGEWVNVKISISGDGSAECSLCGAVVHNNFSNVINFCPNCGQKLDGAKFCPNCGRPTGN